MKKHQPPKAASESPADKPQSERPVYEPPTVIWQEEWEPVALAVSCARLPAENPTCHAAPGTQ